jgi:2-(1,2-epoxy-1,2-dihydrophenyl)acetyl-CoA isomerase
MTSPEPALLYQRDGHVASITFNRPAVLNAINAEMAQLFLEACTSISRDPQVRVVVLRGAGRSFVAGGDLKAFSQDPSSVAPTLIDPLHEGLALLAKNSAPVIGCLHGAVAGAGFSLSLACDLAIAAEGTKFTLAYLNVGSSCDGGASWSLPRIVGLRKAMEIALLNSTLDAAEALRLGIVNWVVPVGDLQNKTDELAARLASGPPIAIGHFKRLLRQSFSQDLVEQLGAERESFHACTATADFTEAVNAFFEKRTARFEGR